MAQTQFNSNNDVSSGLNGIIEYKAQNPSFVIERKMWLSPCGDNEVFEDVTFNEIKCIQKISEEEKKLIQKN